MLNRALVVRAYYWALCRPLFEEMSNVEAERRRTRTPCGWSLAMLLNGNAANCEHENWTRLRALEETPQRVRTESRRESSSSIEAVSREMEEPRTHAQWDGGPDLTIAKWSTHCDRERQTLADQRIQVSDPRSPSERTEVLTFMVPVRSLLARSSPCPHKVATHLSLRASHHLGGLHSEDPFLLVLVPPRRETSALPA